MSNEEPLPVAAVEPEADLRLCNLVSRGYTVAQAKKILAPVVAKEAEQAAENARLAALALEPQTVEELQAALKKAGVQFHENAKENALRKLWAAHKAQASGPVVE